MKPRWGTRAWQLITAVTALVLGGGTCALAAFYARKATAEDRKVMRDLAVEGFQLARNISAFLDERASELARISAEASASQHPASVAHEKALGLMKDDALRAQVSAFGVRHDCLDGSRRKTKADTDSGYCSLPYYKSASIWHRPRPDAKWESRVDEGTQIEADNVPPWVVKAAEHAGTLQVSRLDGTWISKSQTTLESEKQYAPTPLYEGVFHLALGVNLGDGSNEPDHRGVLVVVLDLDHAHLAEFVKVRFEQDGRVISAREGAERFTAADWIGGYKTAHYAYVVDDRAWMIAHPRVWHIIGSIDGGQDVPPAAESKRDLGAKPLNLKTYSEKNRDDMTDYYRAVVDAVNSQNAFYGAGDNMVGHERLVWAQPIFLPRAFDWAPLNDPKEVKARQTDGPGSLFGVVVVGDDLATLSPAQGYAYVYLMIGAVLVFLLEFGIWRWISALAALDGMQGNGNPSKKFSLRDLLPGDRPVQLVRQALERTLAADRHERAKNLLRDVLSQLRGPLTILDVTLQCLRGRDGNPNRPTEELLNEIGLSMDQLKMLLWEANCVKLQSDDIELGRRLAELIEQKWSGRVEFVGPDRELHYHIPWIVIEDSVSQLVSNALRAVDESNGKFVRPQGWKNDVRIELQDTPEGPVIAVMDAGCRVAKHVDPFDWGSSGWTTAGPTPGMGLPCTRLRLSMFGGKVTYSAERGYSARFAISLPSLPRDMRA